MTNTKGYFGITLLWVAMVQLQKFLCGIYQCNSEILHSGLCLDGYDIQTWAGVSFQSQQARRKKILVLSFLSTESVQQKLLYCLDDMAIFLISAIGFFFNLSLISEIKLNCHLTIHMIVNVQAKVPNDCVNSGKSPKIKQSRL